MTLAGAGQGTHASFTLVFVSTHKGTAIRCGQAVAIFSTMFWRVNIGDWRSGQRLGSGHAGLAMGELMVCSLGAADGGVAKRMWCPKGCINESTELCV